MWRVVCGGSRQVKILYLSLNVLWLGAVLASVAINHHYSQQEMESVSKAEARAMYRRDMDFRHWVAAQGGVYVPVTAATPPNPYLNQIPYRDITRPDGAPLTLVNPAYMIRLINESTTGDSDFPVTHMTSLQPLRPENAPDAWEKEALARAANGEDEISQFTTIAGQPYLRYLHATRAEAPCLKCHASQGYKLGDLRGGLVVTLPTGALLTSHDKTLHSLYLFHLLLYLAGVALLFWGQCFVSRRIRERDLATSALAESEANFRTVADYAYAWEYWLGADGKMRYVSPSVSELTGYAPERFLTEPDLLQALVVAEDREIFHDHREQDHRAPSCSLDFRIRTAVGEIRWLHHICRPIYDRQGVFQGRRASNYEITAEKSSQLRNEELISKLREALDKVKTLSGFLPICASCKKIRDDQGYWNQIESYITHHSEAVFSHGICPDCAQKLYPEYFSPDNPPDPKKTREISGE